MLKKGIILLSGGLDSLVSLDLAKKNYEINYGLFFNYGQKPFLEEKKAAQEISDFYKLNLILIDLPFLKHLSDNALTNEEIKDFNDLKSVWIPNRNGLFLNIAASYCDKLNINAIIFGANKEEGVDFPDNTEDFTKTADEFFKFSTLNHPNVIAPCLGMDKIDIINYAIDNNVPLNLIKSCYNSFKNTSKKHCGECMSCKLLKNAILKSKKPKLIEEIF